MKNYKSNKENAGFTPGERKDFDELKDKLMECNIYSDILGSDHCPVGIDINL